MGENRFCTNCGAELVDDATFCVNCGQPVGEADTSTTKTVVSPDPQEAFPETFAEPSYSQQAVGDPLGSMADPFQSPIPSVSSPTQYAYAVPASPMEAPMPADVQAPRDSTKLFTTISIVIITLSLITSVGALIYLFAPIPNNAAQQQGVAAPNNAGGNASNTGTNAGAAGGSNTSNSPNSGSDTGSPNANGSSTSPTQPTTTNTTNTTNTTSSTTNTQQQADSQFRSELVSYYNRLSDYDSRVASAATTFNNNFLSSSMSTRQSYADSCSSLLSEIQQQSNAVSSLSVPTGSAYAEQYRLIRQCYQDLVGRIDCVNRGWQISVRYSNPSAHESEILEPIRSNSSGGNNVYYTDYNNTYPKINL